MEYQNLEHFYVFGPEGSGKTKASLSVADILRDNFFHYIQADRSVGKLLNSFQPYLDNVKVWDGFSHEEIQSAVAHISALLKAAKNPERIWVIVDTIGVVYTDAQDTYSFKKYGMSADDRRQELALKNIKSNIDGFTAEDWGAIKRMFYNDTMYPLCKFWGNNYFLIAHQRPTEIIRGVQTYKASMDADLRTIYERIGYTPHCHHEVSRWVDSLMWLNNLVDPFTMMTVKDTERKYLREPSPFGHFWRDYNLYTRFDNHVR